MEKKLDVTRVISSLWVKKILINFIALRALVEHLIVWAMWSLYWSLESNITPKILIDLFDEIVLLKDFYW